MVERYCVFCEIAAHREPATIFYEDDEVIVFENILGWSRVMLLVVPKEHQTQSDLWENLGSAGRIAVEQGWHHAPEGFRILSNFGPWGMQSQGHGHLHVLDYPDPLLEARRDPPASIVDVVRAKDKVLLRTESALFLESYTIIKSAPPLSSLVVPPNGDRPQTDFWADMGRLGADVVDFGWTKSGNGFRIVSNFPREERLPGGEKGHLHLLGGTFLGHYV